MAVVFVGAAFILMLLAAGTIYQRMGAARDLRLYPPPGELVDVGGHKLHVEVLGEGNPAIVFEAGIGATSLSWTLVKSEIAKFTRVVVYDRAGLGWSEAARLPRTLENILRDLAAVVDYAAADGPVVLAGHSFGGLVALEYACANPSRTAGLVLVDALAASEWRNISAQDAAMLALGVRFARRGAWLAKVGVVRWSLALLMAGSKRLPRLAARLSTGSGSKVTERLVGEVRKLPPEVWPMVRAHWCCAPPFRSLADHLESLPGLAQACRTSCDLGDAPLIVLTAEDANSTRIREHTRIASFSLRGKNLVAQQSGHWIQLDRPELVIEAVREVVNLVRSQPK